MILLFYNKVSLKVCKVSDKISFLLIIWCISLSVDGKCWCGVGLVWWVVESWNYCVFSGVWGRLCYCASLFLNLSLGGAKMPFRTCFIRASHLRKIALRPVLPIACCSGEVRVFLSSSLHLKPGLQAPLFEVYYSKTGKRNGRRIKNEEKRCEIDNFVCR